MISDILAKKPNNITNEEALKEPLIPSSNISSSLNSKNSVVHDVSGNVGGGPTTIY